MTVGCISAAEAARLWGVSLRQVQRLLHEGRIPGATKYGASWMIPADCDRPADLRRREAVEPRPFYTQPRECPELILTSFYNRPGSADSLARTLDGDAAARRLFEASLCYFRGRTGEARRLSEPLLDVEGRPDITLGAGFVLCLCAMYAGDETYWWRARGAMSEVHCATAEQETQRELQLVAVDSGIYDKRSFPEWLKKGCFDQLPGDSFPMAWHIYFKYLMIEKGDSSISYMCGPLISQCKLEGALLSEIYCRLITGVGFHDHGDVPLATEQLDAAIALALPDRLYSPLAELRRNFGVLMDERLAAVDMAALHEVRRLNKRLIAGWSVLYTRICGRAFSAELTQREYHAAKLASKGLNNAEIAQRMGLSVNTVKRYIAEALGKTGAGSRSELSKYIGID